MDPFKRIHDILAGAPTRSPEREPRIWRIERRQPAPASSTRGSLPGDRGTPAPATPSPNTEPGRSGESTTRRIRELIARRDIRRLTHFTRAANLSSILEHGLLSRQALRERRLEVLVSDRERIDKQWDATCLSISHPNYKVMTVQRARFPEAEWVALHVSPSVLWRHACEFCIENSASHRIRSTAPAGRRGADALERMFEDVDGWPSRITGRLGVHEPTNPQAEVLAFGDIDPADILQVDVLDHRLAVELRSRYRDVRICSDRRLFHARHDCWQWR